MATVSGSPAKRELWAMPRQDDAVLAADTLGKAASDR
ncbi:hypothetical protein HNP40_003050 [Mycobacteroides chelonae]|nr:hypothetical protein [Mycobacteroides chelonae]